MDIRYTLLVLLFVPVLLTAQLSSDVSGPYHLSIKRELSYGAAALGLLGGGQLLYQRVEPVALLGLRRPRVPGFDRSALMGNSSADAAAVADAGLLGSLSLPLVAILQREDLREGVNLLIIAAETMAINQGLTDLMRSSIRRPRPYIYRVEVATPEAQATARDRTSFPSPYTSNAAAAAFFFGRVYADYHPASKLRPFVWGVSAVLPALTAYLEYRGRQAFLSDVVVGYALGASVGYLVPALHRKPLANGRLSVIPSGGGLYLSYALH